jgi:hypothetical protein
MHGNHEEGDGSIAPCTGRMTTTTTATTAGGIGIVPHKASWIIATTVHLIATNLAVVAELGTAVVVTVVAKAEAVGTAAKQMEE